MSANCQRNLRAPARAQQHTASPFNARGIVEAPEFVLDIPPAKAKGIHLTVYAHRIDSGWIAEAEWRANSGHLPGDGLLPHCKSHPFASRSEAVDDALNRALRSIRGTLGAKAEEPAWAVQIGEAAERVRRALTKERHQDTSLPLHGKTFIDLCAGGMGGFALALTRLGATCALACDIDPQALALYSAHASPLATHADLCTLDGTRLKADFLTIGMVCTAHSKGGKRQGMANPEVGKVHEGILRFIGEVDAQTIIVECARQLLNHGGGRDAARVRKALMRAGYRVQHRTLDACRFGVPQARERAFIVATRIGAATNDALGFCFPEGEDSRATVADVLEQHQLGDIPASRIKRTKAAPHGRSAMLKEVALIDGKDHQGYRVYDPSGIGPALCASSGGACPQTGAYLIGGKARGLTPREAYRMQGMPEWASHHANRRQALKHAGNGVAVPVVRAIAQAVAKYINQ